MKAGEVISDIDPTLYRRVLGQYPTGVCVVTAASDDGELSGMVVGSFTSVSMDPPLVAFYPAKSSSSWPKIAAAGRFCVNILSAEQEATCRTFASKGGDKFASASHRRSQDGPPILDDVVGWIDCEIEAVQDAGDHLFVLGRVLAMDVGTGTEQLPLLFFQGGYGRFSPLSLATEDAQGELSVPLAEIEPVRPLMERFAADFECRCISIARSGGELVVITSAGKIESPRYQATLVGQRLPYIPPAGSVFAAWDDPREVSEWLRMAVTDETKERHQLSLRLVAERGYSVGLISASRRKFVATLDELAARPFENRTAPLTSMMRELSHNPVYLNSESKEAIRQISAPVFRKDGSVAFAVTAYGFGRPRFGIDAIISGLLDMSAAATRRIGGQFPPSHPSSVR